ncbi:unnamed protein product [Discula destructiva]
MPPGNTPSTLAWYPRATADALPPMMLETDPCLSCQHLEDIVESIVSISTHCPIYRYSRTLAYKPVCRKRETKFIHLAGSLTLPVVSKVGIVDDIGSCWYQKGTVLELGEPLVVTSIPPAERATLARQMTTLVTRLHDKGVIHGDVKLGNFVKTPGKDESLRIVGFSAARMRDDSDLASWPAAVPSPEYASPSRWWRDGPSTPSGDEYALAVSIWALFAGEEPTYGLFSSNEGLMPDLAKITNDELYRAVVDVLAEGGLDVQHAGETSRRSTSGTEMVDPFPPRLFGLGADVMSRPTAVKSNPGLSDYARQWLQGQQTLEEPCAHEKSRLLPAPGSSTRYATQPPSLLVDTGARHHDIEAPAWTAVSNATSRTATVTASEGDRIPGRGRSTTVLRVPPLAAIRGESGCESTSRASLVTGSETNPVSGRTSMERSLSHWSESSLESLSGDDESAVDSDDRVSRPGGSSPPLTPMPLSPKRVRGALNFESVALSDDEGNGGVSVLAADERG